MMRSLLVPLVAAALLSHACAPARDAPELARNSTVAVTPALAQDTAAVVESLTGFLAWWDSVSAPTFVPDTGPPLPPPGVNQHRVSVAELLTRPDSVAPAPPALEPNTWRAFVLDTSILHTVVWLPLDSDTAAEGPLPCTKALARLGVPPYERWTSIPLNPFCDPTYSPEEADLVLYRLPNVSAPLVLLLTNGPACVPTVLLALDEKARVYREIRRACIG